MSNMYIMEIDGTRIGKISENNMVDRGVLNAIEILKKTSAQYPTLVSVGIEYRDNDSTYKISTVPGARLPLGGTRTEMHKVNKEPEQKVQIAKTTKNTPAKIDLESVVPYQDKLDLDGCTPDTKPVKVVKKRNCTKTDNTIQSQIMTRWQMNLADKIYEENRHTMSFNAMARMMTNEVRDRTGDEEFTVSESVFHRHVMRTFIYIAIEENPKKLEAAKKAEAKRLKKLKS